MKIAQRGLIEQSLCEAGIAARQGIAKQWPGGGKLHVVTDAKGGPIRFVMSAGQMSDYNGAAALLISLPKPVWLLGDRGYDADWPQEALKDKGIKVCIPGRKSRWKAVKYNKRR